MYIFLNLFKLFIQYYNISNIGFGLNNIAIHLNINNNIIINKKFIKINYNITKSICNLNHKNNKYYLNLGGLLAIADTVTTLVIMHDDITHRPGIYSMYNDYIIQYKLIYIYIYQLKHF